MKFHRKNVEGVPEKTLNCFCDIMGELNENNIFYDILENCDFYRLNKKQKTKLKKDILHLCKQYINSYGIEKV